MSELSKQLWRNIMKIRNDGDEEFVRYILEARSEYLSLRLKQEPAIREIYVKAAANVADDIARLAPGASDLTRNHLRALEKSLTREAENIRRALEGRLRSDLQRATGLGARPLQSHVTRCLQAAGVPLDILRVQRGFGDVNTAAVEAIWARTRGGMKLSDRIWATSDNARDNMRSIILDGVARGRDSAKVARDLERYVKQGAATMAGDYPGMMARIGKRVPKDLCYEAFRLARSEMSMAFMEGTYASGRVNPAYKGVRWLLSSSHPVPDICDDLASADLYGLGPGGYPAGDEPPYPHANCLCTVAPLVEDTKEFVERLKKWRDDPASQPELEKWYNEVYLGPAAQQPPPPQAGVAAPVPAQPTPPKAQPRVAMTKAEWDRGLGKLAGKKGAELDAAVDELKQRFRAAFDAELEFNSGFLNDMSRRVKGGKTRKAVAELGVALNRMPIEATRDNASFQILRLGERLGGLHGDFDPATGVIRIDVQTFATQPQWAPNRLSHGYETLLHEVGHAVHKAQESYFAPWVDEMWDLDPLRQGAGLWDLRNYMRSTGRLKDPNGSTPYGRMEPLEDFADTWRLLYLEQSAVRRNQVYSYKTNPQDGKRVLGEAYTRFRLLGELIAQMGWRVPKL